MDLTRLAFHLLLILLPCDPLAAECAGESPCACYQDGVIWTCITDELTDVPLDLPHNITRLHIEGHNIPTVSSVPYPNLVNLVLKNNSMVNINPGAFGELSKLHQLSLTYNKIKNLDPEVFVNLSSLTLLALNGNPLQELKSGTFNGDYLHNLQVLDLTETALDRIEQDSFMNLKNLDNLVLAGNRLGSVPLMGKSDFPNLRVFNLTGNQILQASGHPFAAVPHLLHLDMNKNGLRHIFGNTFTGLTKLTHLNLAQNNLRTVPPNSLSVLNNLTNLDLSSNNFRVIEKDRVPRNLEKLYLYDNPWHCDCITKWIRVNLVSLSSNTETNFTCASPHILAGHPVLLLKSSVFICPHGSVHHARQKMWIAMTVIIVLVVASTATYMTCSARRRRRLERQSGTSVPYSRVIEEKDMFSI